MKRYSLLFLILSNLVPLAGVSFFGWNMGSILVLFWMENLVIGFWNVLKMKKAEKKIEGTMRINGKPARQNAKLAIIFFFVVHYGMFTLAHGVFVFTLFAKDGLYWPGILAGFISMFISHGISYVTNFINGREYASVSPSKQMMAPYSRMIVMHVAIILGAFLSEALGIRTGALIILVIGKMIIDATLHIREHKKIGAKMEAL